MLNDSLLKSNFIGRDGFRWWIGQIPKDSVNAEQIGGTGWGNRSKVRILGYHPFDESLKDEDLPWALIVIPTTSGSGARGRAENVKLSQGDIVTGFFADGDDAQIPVINGLLGRTEYVSSAEFKSPFTPFTGYTDTIEPKDPFIPKNEANEQNARSQQAPRTLSRSKALDVGPDERPASSSYGLCINLATGNSKSALEGISVELENFSNTLSEVKQGISTKVGNVQQSIDRLIDDTASSITKHAQGIAGPMIKNLYESLAPIIKQGLITLYDIVYKIVFAATGLETAAHLAGVAAQNALYVPIKAISEALPCVLNKVIKSLGSVIKDMVSEVADNVTNFSTCIVEQVVGGIGNKIISEVTDFMSPLFGGIEKILFGFDFVSFLRSNAEGLLGIISALSCNEESSTKDNTSKYCVGKGPGKTPNTSVESALELANIANNTVQDLINAGQSVSQITGSLGVWDFNNPSVSKPGFLSELGSCYSGPPLDCVTGIEIFGGGGVGALGKLVLGNLVGPAGAQTASIIGVDLVSKGSGYVRDPMISISDNCDSGYGAIARGIVDTNTGELSHIYMVSEGENYPIIGPASDYVIAEILVVKSGSGFGPADTVKVKVAEGEEDPLEYRIITDDETSLPPAPPTVDLTDGIGGGVVGDDDTGTGTGGDDIDDGVIDDGLDDVDDGVIDDGDGTGNGTIVKIVPINNDNRIVRNLPTFEFITESGTGAVLSARLKVKPDDEEEQRESDKQSQQLIQVIDCIS